MSQLLALQKHLREKHFEESKGNDTREHLAAWLENNFITPEELDKVVDFLKDWSPRAMVLACGVS